MVDPWLAMRCDRSQCIRIIVENAYLVSAFQQQPHVGASNAELAREAGIGDAELPVIPGWPVRSPNPGSRLGLLQG